MKVFIYLIIFLFNLPLFGQQGISVSMSAKTYWGIAGIDYGLGFALVSMETSVIYHSKIVSPFRQRHSIIENLPPGTYRIFYFGDSPIGQTPDNRVHDYFGFLQCEKGKSYYLGNFVGIREIGRNVPIVYTIKDTEVSKGLTKSLRRKGIIGSDEQLIKTYPYNSDSLVIGLEPKR